MKIITALPPLPPQRGEGKGGGWFYLRVKFFYNGLEGGKWDFTIKSSRIR